LANSAGFQEGDQVWFYHPTEKREKSNKIQSSWEGPYNVVTQINDVIDQIQQHTRPFHDVFKGARDIDRRRFYPERQKFIEGAKPEQVISLCPALADVSVLVTGENLMRQWMNNCVLVLQGNQGISEPVT
jgi:hypothetical protein